MGIYPREDVAKYVEGELGLARLRARYFLVRVYKLTHPEAEELVAISEAEEWDFDSVHAGNATLLKRLVKKGLIEVSNLETFLQAVERR